MQLSNFRLAVAGLALLVVGGCGGGGTDPDGGGGGGGEFGISATVNGVAWKPTIQAGGAHLFPGGYNFSGLSTASGGSSMTFVLYNVAGPGTYPLGMGPSGFGGTAQWVKGTAGWVTVLSGAAGSITITAISNSHITGSFHYSAGPLSGGATGTVEVTDGHFDLPITTTGDPGSVPDQNGSRITADVDGASYNASTIAATLPNDTSLVVASTTVVGGLGIQLYGLHDPGSYDLSADPVHTLTFSHFDGTDFNLWGGVAGDSGSIVITSRSATRITGTYTVRLAPAFGPGATAPIHVTGEFTLGMPQF